MAKITPITEHFQHFLADLKDSFWGDVYGTTRQAWKNFLEEDSLRQRDRWTRAAAYERKPATRRDYRNGYYERDFVTRFGAIRLRIARTRGKNFLPCPGESSASSGAPRNWRCSSARPFCAASAPARSGGSSPP